MAADLPLPSLTLFELMSLRKTRQVLLGRFEKSMNYIQRHIHQVQREIDKRNITLEELRMYGVVATEIRRRESVIEHLEGNLADSQDSYLSENRICDRIKVELGEIDEEIMRCKLMENVEAEPLTVFVHLLSGDVLSNKVDRSMRISDFTDYFCKVHGYAPCAAKHMIFMKKQDDEVKRSDELEDTILWSEEIRRMGEVMSDRVEDGDTIYLLIEPLEDPEWADKFALFSRILEKEKRTATVSDEDIFGIYSTWLITWIPPAKTNRYIRMKAFLDAHLDIFPMTEKDA